MRLMNFFASALDLPPYSAPSNSSPIRLKIAFSTVLLTWDGFFLIRSKDDTRIFEISLFARSFPRSLRNVSSLSRFRTVSAADWNSSW